jgi:hypothetical protein
MSVGSLTSGEALGFIRGFKEVANAVLETASHLVVGTAGPSHIDQRMFPRERSGVPDSVKRRASGSMWIQ